MVIWYRSLTLNISSIHLYNVHIEAAGWEMLLKVQTIFNSDRRENKWKNEVPVNSMWIIF